MQPLLLIAIPFLLIGVWFVLERVFIRWLRWRSRRAWRREFQRLTRVPTMELVTSAREAVKFEHWERFDPAAELLQRDRWTDEALRQTLDALYAALVEEDRVQGRSG